MTIPATTQQNDGLRPITPAERQSGRLIVRDYGAEGIHGQEFAVSETTEVLRLDVTRRVYEEIVIHTHALDRAATVADVLRREEVEVIVERRDTPDSTLKRHAAAFGQRTIP